MYKKVLSLCLLACSFFAAKAVYYPVPLGGLNQDIVANGGPTAVTNVTTADVDGVSYNFMSLDYRTPSNVGPTSALPNNGIINSVATSGLTFRLADYNLNNALRLPATGGSGTGSGTVTFLIPVKATTVYVLATTGSGSSTNNFTVNFDDGTNQQFTNISVADWFGNSGFAIQGISRVNRSNNGIENSTTDPRLYQITLAISAGNQNKKIVSVDVSKTSTGGILNLMAVSVNTTVAPTCNMPTNAAISNLTGTTATFSWTASSPAPLNYNWKLVAGNSAVTATAIQQGTPTGTSVNLASLTPNTTYTLYLRSICGSSLETDTSLWVWPVTFTTPCAGPPAAPGTTASTMSAACSSESFILSVTGNTTGTYSYQWQQSIDGGATWTDISAATALTTTVSGLTTTTRYRLRQACAADPTNYVYSTPAIVTSRACYCTPTYSNGCSSWRTTSISIPSVPFSHSPSCGTTNNTAISFTLTAGIQYAMTVVTTGYVAVGVAADFNNNGNFADAGELLALPDYSVNQNSPATWNFNITIPPTVLGGTYRIRIWNQGGNSGNMYGGACGAYGYGGYHDYTVNVINNATCQPPANVAASNIGPYSATLSWNAPSTTTPVSYQWKVVAGGAPVTDPAIQTAIYPASVTSVIPTGLTPNTSYTFYVRSACGPGPSSDDSSYWALPVTFTTTCANPPTPGTTVASVSNVSCPTDAVTLSLTGNTTGNSFLYQWQNSTDNGTTWTNVASATNATLTITGQSVTTQYRLRQACVADPNNFVYSIPTTVTKSVCYCKPTFTSGCTTWRLTNVTFGSINNSPSTCTVSDYTSMSTTVPVGVGLNMSITAANYVGIGVYIDFNGDGNFNGADEFMYGNYYSGAQTTTETPTIVIPGYIPSGSYRMRVVAAWGTSLQPGAACNTFQYGNFHDYTVNVINPYTCYPPTGIAISNILYNAATITWSAPPATSPTSYDWVVVPAGGSATDPAIASGTTTGTSATATGLGGNTQYSVFVRSNCGAGDMSLWTAPAVNFTTALPPCVTPPATTASASSTVLCTGGNVVLNISSPITVAQLTFQWQSSPNGANTWTNIGSSQSTPAYTITSQTGTVDYRCIVSCVNGGTPTPSSIVTVYAAPAVTYCTPPSRSCTSSDVITNVTLTGINNSSGCDNFNGSTGYSNYTCSVAPAVIMQGTTYPISVTLGAGGTEYAAVWIDYNQNGSFEASEYTSLGSNSGGTINTTITLPTSANVGITRMRVRVSYSTAWTSADGNCTGGNATYGETEDYSVNIIPLPPCQAPAAQPTSLVLTPYSLSVSGTFAAAVPAANKYLVVRTPNGDPLNTVPSNTASYNVGDLLGNGYVVSVSNATTFTDNGLVANTTYRYTVFSYNDVCSGGPVYQTANPLVGVVHTNAVNIYHWNGSPGNALGSTNFQDAANWLPNRTTLDPADELWFDNGRTDNTVTNVPTQTIGRLRFLNTTAATWQPQTGAARTFTINSDNNPATLELDIQQGSSLVFNAPATLLTMNFGGSGATAGIAGTLEASNASGTIYNVFDLTNVVMTVTPTGTIAGGGATGTASFQNTTITNLIINGTYNHKYTTSSGPAIPTASWNTGSTVLISGYTTATGGPNGGMNQVFYNFTYNCPSQSTNTNWSGTGPLTATGTFTMTSTGTGTLQFASTQAYNYVINNYVQTGGTLNLSSGTPAGAQTLNISGTFNQTGGTLISSGAGSATNKVSLNFNGTTAQAVNFFNVAPTGPITYRISNNAGINMTGTGNFTGTPAFNLNSNGGVQITSLSANPINTSLVLTYGTSATTLTYDAPGTIPATAVVWPATNGPINVTIANGGGAYAVTMPFSRTISGTLNMTSGDIDLNSNVLTLGTAAATAGTLTYTSGSIRLTTGSFVRWYNTSGLPTAVGTGVGFYPVASANGLNRNVALAFSSATALSAGGTIAVSHNNVSGLTNGLSVVDAAYTIGSRTNANWVFTTGSGITASGTVIARITESGLFTSPDASNLRVMNANSVVGTHSAGGGTFYANRTGLSLAQLTAAPFYIGSATTNMVGTYTAIATGNWSNPAIWDINAVPGVTNIAYIDPGVNVTVDIATATAKALTLNPSSTLTLSANTLTIDSVLVSNGTVNNSGGTLIVNGNTGTVGITNNLGANFNVSGGTVRLGPAGGSLKPFNNNGTLTVSGSGTLNINGNLALNANSTFNQSGGNINIDGNAAGVQANSVASGTKIVNILTPNVNLTGGTFTIVDPHVSTAGTNTFEYNFATTNVNASGTHIFRVGDGVSTDAGGNASYAFSINTAVSSGRFNFNHLVVNGGTATNSFCVQGASPMGVLGNLTVNSGGEFRQPSGQTVYVNGNIVVNTGGTLTSAGSATIGLASYLNAVVAPATAAQTITVAGTIRNATASPTANLVSIYLNNTSAGGVTVTGNDLSYSGTLTFMNGKIFMGTNTLIQTATGSFTGASQAVGWVVGRFQKNMNTGAVSNSVFPIGNTNYYTPVEILSGTVATAGGLRVNTTNGDHPNIATSTITGLRSVNRYWTLASQNGLAFTANTANLRVNWNAADVDAGANYLNFGAARYTGSAWMTPAPTASVPQPTSLRIAGLPAALDGDYQVGELCPFPVVDVQPVASQQVCVGSPFTISVTASSISTPLTYQWYKGGIPLGSATSSSYYVSGAVAGDAGNYTVTVTNACGKTTTSAISVLTVNPTVPASVTIVSDHGTSTCVGSNVIFTAYPTNGGAAPVYEWYVSGVLQAATGNTFQTSTLSMNDVVQCKMISNAQCPVPAIANSNILVMTVNPLTPASVTISTASSTTICAGTSVTFTALPVYGGTTPTYQWKVGGIPQGTNSATFTTSSLVAGTNNITCEMTSSAVCPNPVTATSNTIVMTVNPILVPSVSITASSTNICQGDYVTFTATPVNPGATPHYQWTKGGMNVGTDAPTYTDNTLSDNDQIVCTLTSNATCANPTSVGSNTVVMTVRPRPVASVTASGPTTFCQGGNVVLTAATGTGLTYQWFNGTTSLGAASANNTLTVTASGNYTVVVRNGSNCNDTSAAIAVTVNPLPPATITPSGTVPVCQGSSVTLLANTAAGMSYQWRKDGGNLASETSSNYVASTAGSYDVVITNPVTGCSATSVPTVVTITTLPVITITAGGPLTFCEGGAVTLQASGGTSYQWYKGGVAIGSATLSTYVATTSGSYTVVGTAVGGCQNTSASVVVTVNPYPLATITPIGGTSICTGQTVLLNANAGSGYSYQWYRGGQPLVGATSISYTADMSGGYTVEVTSPAGCTTASAVTAITVNTAPTATVTASGNTTLCQGETVTLHANTGVGYTYQWYNGGTAIFGEVSNSYTATTSGNYSVEVRIGNCATLSAQVSVIVNVMPSALITPVGSTTICQGNSVALHANTGAGLTYVWYKDGDVIGGATAATYNATTSGSYTVVVSNGGCTATSAAVSVTMIPISAVVIASGSTTICEGGSVTLSAPNDPAYTYQWRKDGLIINGATFYSYAANQTGDYVVEVSNGSCTYTSAIVHVTQNAVPVPAIAISGNVLTTATFYSSYQWYLNGYPITNATANSYTASQSGTYSVTVTDVNGCTAGSLPTPFVPTGVGSVTLDLIKVYPNPATSVLVVDAPVPVNVSLYAMDGKEVLHQENAKTLKIADLANGVYMMRIMNASNELIKVERIVKEGK